MDKEKQLEYLRGLEKLKASKVKADDYVSPLESDILKVKGASEVIPADVTRIKGMTDKIDTKGASKILSGADFQNKIAALRALKGAGKKVAGIIPFAGAGMAALSGDPAMAAEELATDAAGPAGIAYEALKPDVAGNPEEEAMMLAERNAMEDYKSSPAKADRLAKLKMLMNKK